MEKNVLKQTSVPLYRERFNQTYAEELFEQIVKHLKKEKRYRNAQYTMAQLADELHVSRRYITATVYKCTGDNYKMLINQMRMKIVMRIMHSNDYRHMSIEDIAFLAGYTSRQAFHLAFKRMYGCSPSEYRKQADLQLNE